MRLGMRSDPPPSNLIAPSQINFATFSFSLGGGGGRNSCPLLTDTLGPPLGGGNFRNHISLLDDPVFDSYDLQIYAFFANRHQTKGHGKLIH